MSKLPPHSIVATHALTDGELASARALAEICTSSEDIDLRIVWSVLQGGASAAPQVFLCYAGGTLIGFLSLFGVGSVEAEGGGMVHPRYRRTGVFTALVAAARATCRQHHTGALVLVCDRQSAAASAFCDAIGAAYTGAEHLMTLEAPAGIVAPDGRIDVTRASLADADAIAAILAADDGSDVTGLRQVVAGELATGSRQYYLATARGGEPIGTLNVHVIDGAPYIYGLVIRPEQRGRGYGKQVLAYAIAEISAAGAQPILLEVETDNAAALALYGRLGFQITRTYAYYRVEA